MNPSEPIEITLTALVYGGEALGRLADGKAVFVPYALPGEKVVIRLIEEKKGYARGELLQVLQPAPQRVAPRCRHFGLCGGCHYQHMTYAAQLQAKRDILAEQLERIGGIANPPVQPTVASPQAWNYRNYVQFHLTPQGALGYTQAGSERVIPITECHLPLDSINDLWPKLEFEAIPGLERIGVRAGEADDLQLILESTDPQPPEISVEGLPISVVHLSPAGALVLVGSEWVIFDVLGRRFRVSAGAFFQVNTPMAAALVEHVLERLPSGADLSALEVYSGVGLFSAFLAPRFARLVCVEASAYACADFQYNLDEFDHVVLYQAPAEQVLPHVDFHPDFVLVDPPRSGLGARVVDQLLRLQAGRLIYLSCDAATLARDAKRLIRGGYTLKEITPFDLFPQTYHIESLSLWEWAR
jgi:23S rRNA (uracil1939-C5)-methyltransferase